VEFKLPAYILPFNITSPEIPDSSKWSSNTRSTIPLKKQSSPEIPDSSKWSSNLDIVNIFVVENYA